MEFPSLSIFYPKPRPTLGNWNRNTGKPSIFKCPNNNQPMKRIRYKHGIGHFLYTFPSILLSSNLVWNAPQRTVSGREPDTRQTQDRSNNFKLLAEAAMMDFINHTFPTSVHPVFVCNTTDHPPDTEASRKSEV